MIPCDADLSSASRANPTMHIDHTKSASTRGASGNAVAGYGDIPYPVDGADEGWADVRANQRGRSLARSVLVGAT